MFRVFGALIIASLTVGATAQVTVLSDPAALRPNTPDAAKNLSSTITQPSMPAGPDTLSNATVVELVRAGLGPEAIIAKINASNGSYDTSTSALIQLKQSGVFDGVIAAMLQRSTTPVLTTGRADSTSPNPLDPHAPGIYLLDNRANSKMVRIDATLANQTKSSNMWGYALTSGISSMKVKAVIPNAHARVQVASRRPVFYFYFNQTGTLATLSQFGSAFTTMASSPNEFSLVRLEQKKDRREASVGSVGVFSGVKSGISDKARVAFTYDDVAPGVFKVSPSTDLLPGQYGFLHSTTPGAGARVFDFAIL